MQPTEINIARKFLVEPPRETPIVREVDVLVCGGGVSGVGAALGAARAGAKTMVLERNAFLGGAATAVIMNTWNVPVSRMTGVTREIAMELAQRGEGNISGPTFPFDPEGFKQLSSELMAEAGVEVLNYTWVEETIMEGSRIKGVIIQNKSGRQAILARTVVDATEAVHQPHPCARRRRRSAIRDPRSTARRARCSRAAEPRSRPRSARAAAS